VAVTEGRASPIWQALSLDEAAQQAISHLMPNSWEVTADGVRDYFAVGACSASTTAGAQEVKWGILT